MLKNLIVLSDGTELFSGSNITPSIQKVSLTECVNSGTELMLGSVCSNMIEVTIIDPGGSLHITAGDEVKLFSVDDAGNRKQVGIFSCEKPTHPTANTVRFTAYDRAIRLDKDLTEWLAALDGWPYELEQFIRLILLECNLGLITAVPNDAYTVNRFTAQNVTGRQLLQWAVEMTGRFFRINATGSGELAWYKDASKTISPSGEMYYFMNGLTFEDYEVQPVGAVQIKLADSNEGYLWPEAEAGTNSYIIENNPIATAQIDSTTSGYLDNLKSVLEPVRYTPCRLSVPADLDIHAGDIINVIDRNGKEITAYVMTSVRTGQKITLECTGSHRRDSPTAQYSRPTSVIATDVAQRTVSSMTPLQVFNKLTNNGEYQGIYMLDGQIYINGTYIQTGQLSAENVSLSGDFSVYSGDTLGGHVGYMAGSDGETETSGIGVRSADGTSYAIATDAGLRMQSGTFKTYIVKDKRLVVAGDLWCIGGLQVKSITPYSDGNMEWKYISAIGETVLVKTGD